MRLGVESVLDEFEGNLHRRSLSDHFEIYSGLFQVVEVHEDVSLVAIHDDEPVVSVQVVVLQKAAVSEPTLEVLDGEEILCFGDLLEELDVVLIERDRKSGGFSVDEGVRGVVGVLEKVREVQVLLLFFSVFSFFLEELLLSGH